MFLKDLILNSVPIFAETLPLNQRFKILVKDAIRAKDPNNKGKIINSCFSVERPK